jgi:hypothetical protein
VRMRRALALERRSLTDLIDPCGELALLAVLGGPRLLLIYRHGFERANQTVITGMVLSVP